jgi:methionyl-tRNA formyltransferase
VMIDLKNVLFLAANTARSKAYAHALHLAGIKLERVLFLERNNENRADGNKLPDCYLSEYKGVPFPNLSYSFLDICGKISDRIDHISCVGVKDPCVEEYIKVNKSELVIYSGFGGELVPNSLLSAETPFLHLHAGWLPDYRGSTTIYYSLLENARCGVSAILLNEKIDEGSIVGRRYYPPPPPGVDVDYLYDNSIRADLLVRVLSEWSKERKFTTVEAQSRGEGSTYYVIHPILKHLALIGLEKGTLQASSENDMNSFP